MTMIDWAAPETWHVGDTLNAETWTRRWVNPMSLLLRRPTTIARRTTDQSVASNSTFHDTYLTFDALDRDDDGMAMVGDGPFPLTGQSVSTFYTQRAGVFDFYLAVPWLGNGQSGYDILGAAVEINADYDKVQNYSRQGPNVGSSGTDNPRSGVFTATLVEGDTIRVPVWNFTGASATVKAQWHAPRFIMMWRGPTA